MVWDRVDVDRRFGNRIVKCWRVMSMMEKQEVIETCMLVFNARSLQMSGCKQERGIGDQNDWNLKGWSRIVREDMEW